MWYDHRKHANIEGGMFGIFKVEFQQRRFQVLDESASFVQVRAAQLGPQGGAEDENLPPDTTDVGQHEQAFIHVIFVEVFWDERENYGRNQVYGREQVLQRPDQGKYL